MSNIEETAPSSPKRETVIDSSPPSMPEPAFSPPPSPPPTAPPVNLSTRPDTSRTSSQEHGQPETVAEPKVAALRAMFPDYDDAILQMVLQSANGIQDRAVDTLLGMSDPEYKSDGRIDEPQLTQTELDEQLARRLVLEEQEEQEHRWLMQNQSPELVNAPHGGQRRSSRRTQPQQQQSPTAGSGDTMSEFQGQFNKMAETGKKTLGSLFSKVKAKIQELDQPKTGQNPSSQTQPIWGEYQSNNSGYQSYNPQGRHAAIAATHQQPAYYDPNPPVSPSTFVQPRNETPPAVQGYDVTPETTQAPAQSSSSTSQPPAQMPTQGTPIDGGKLGLLPKRPVSLIREPKADTEDHQPRRPSQEDDDSGLEYAENPFDEPKK